MENIEYNFKKSVVHENYCDAKKEIAVCKPSIERFVIGKIFSYFKGSPIAVIKSSEFDEKIYVKTENIPWFLRETGSEVCFDVVRTFDYKHNKTVLKAINVIPTSCEEYSIY